MRDLDELAAITNQAIQIGHDILSSSTPTGVRAKSDRDFVTDIDLLIEREIRAYLARATPEAGFLGEEEGQVGDPGTTWTLDPIDGTTNYVHGLPMYAISLALVHGGAALTAAIDSPALGLRYTATTGHHAYCNGVPIHASDTTELTRAVIAIGDFATGDRAAAKNVRRLRLTAALSDRVERIRMLGSAALDLAFVAHGKLDAAIMLSNKPWDTMAGSLLARCSGAHVVDSDGSTHSTASIDTIAAASNLLTVLTESISFDLKNGPHT